MNTRVQVDILRKAVVVPVLAVQHGPDGLFVDVVKPDQTVDPVPIKVGYQSDGEAVITSGLAGGVTVITSGQSRVAAGTHVRTSNPSTSAASNVSPS